MTAERCEDPSSPPCLPTGSSNCIPIACVDPQSDNGGIRLCYSTSPCPIPIDTPESESLDLVRKALAEYVGTALLLIIVVGSGIMSDAISDDDGIKLFINSFATAAGLFGIITIFGPISGAHFNPAVSFVDYLYGDMNVKNLVLYTIVQIVGGISGTIFANIQFKLNPIIEFSSTERFGYNLWISEIFSTCTLILIIHGSIRTGQKSVIPTIVSAWVGGGYFFTSSSIFANPAVTIARCFTESYTGINPKSVGPYIAFQIIGATIGYGLSRFFFPKHLQALKQDDNLYRRACVLDMKDFFEKKSY